MDKKISELDQALQINNDAVFPISQDNGGTDTTYKVSITQLSSEVGEDQTFSNLQTSSKKLVGAINELYQGGGGGGSSTLAGLSDVDIDDQTLSDGQVLKYDSAEDKWVNDDVGAGGHTIVADDGTDLAQRANLQFIGAYSEDNSGDDTTEVNVVRNMTKAQLEQLSADEKTGFINTTDETSQIYATSIPISSSDSTNTKAYIDSAIANIGIVQSLTMPQPITTTSTQYNTYNSRKFSDYDLIIFKMGSSENDIRQTVILPQSVWSSGKTITMGALHGASASTPSSYSYSNLSISYYSDTGYTALVSGSGTLNNLIIWGVKLKTSV